jgi:preprotein translocase subunit SecG
MELVLLVIHLFLATALVGVILLQRSEGGALGMGGGGAGSFMSARGAANLLTRTTAILATLFIVTSLALAIMASNKRAPRSIVDQPTPAGPARPGQPPAGQPPAGQPPAGQPPAGQPPAGQPAQPPAGQPAQPPAQPPAGERR